MGGGGLVGVLPDGRSGAQRNVLICAALQTKTTVVESTEGARESSLAACVPES
jgi:hypothetical protein